MPAIGELNGVPVEDCPGWRFVALEVTERGRMLEGERQWLNRAVKAHEPNRARQIPGGPQDGKRISGRAQTHIPDHEFTGMLLEPLAEVKLIDVKSLRLRHRPDDRMKSFAVRQGMKAVGAVGQPDQFI
jgi:hypothetical protein